MYENDESELNDGKMQSKGKGSMESPYKLLKKNDFINKGMEENIPNKKPKDPFKDLDPLTQKVDITKGVGYQGTSQNDVLQQRFVLDDLEEPMRRNQYIRLRNTRTNQDPDHVDNDYVRTMFEPYQLKTFYYPINESSDEADDEDSGEDQLHLQR